MSLKISKKQIEIVKYLREHHNANLYCVDGWNGYAGILDGLGAAPDVRVDTLFAMVRLGVVCEKKETAKRSLFYLTDLGRTIEL